MLIDISSIINSLSIIKSSFFACTKVREIKPDILIISPEYKYVNSQNHLVLISPRRFGKSSLVKRAISQTGSPCIFINMQYKECAAVTLMHPAHLVFSLFTYTIHRENSRLPQKAQVKHRKKTKSVGYLIKYLYIYN